MNARHLCLIAQGTALALAWACPWSANAASSQILGWNNLGMHCMDSDYSVFSVLPSYNTLEAQLIVNGQLVTNGNGYTVTYEAVADPDGSFNSTAMGKGNFYEYAKDLYGAALAAETGLAGWSMPGLENVPQSMLFEPSNAPAAGVVTPVNWFRAEGIPLSPYDDAHHKNPYPLMRLIARNASHQPIATNDVVLPVSDEMDCRACHASGTQDAAKPAGGWVWNGLPERDFRLNILRLHDERQFQTHNDLYAAALAARGFNAQGLYRGVLVDNKPVLCAACHASEALGAPSYGAIPPLTASVHSYHAHVMDPVLNANLDSVMNRAACYRCHPGSTTRCLRGAMGSAIAADGSMEMQCQSCHGNMSAVGSTNRVGWFMEPNCQACHSGTATANAGIIRYTSALVDSNGTVRVPANRTFATQNDIPAPGLSLYRFSAGHGGLQCSACHGSTHAEFPSSHRNDNLRNLAVQGHAGVMIECTACHPTMTSTAATMSGGPHGMHPVTQDWVNNHHNLLQSGTAGCHACHGADYRGTVLSRAQADRNWSAFGGHIVFNRGATIGCYTCHQGPSEGDSNPSTPPAVANVSTNCSNEGSVALALPVTGVGAVLRIISQPANGSVGLSNGMATYFPYPGFAGVDQFTYAAYDGSKNSGLGTGTVTVAQGRYTVVGAAHVPPSYPAAWPVPFGVVPDVSNTPATPTFEWDFGDASPHSSTQFAVHSYTVPGNYNWTVTTTVGGISATNRGVIQIGGAMAVTATQQADQITLSWPNTLPEVLLESTSAPGAGATWTCVSNTPAVSANLFSVTLPHGQSQFFRLRRPW